MKRVSGAAAGAIDAMQERQQIFANRRFKVLIGVCRQRLMIEGVLSIRM